jgi:RNA recognition motif. (a.k.a. RRM, RBD, or RNP domain)
VTNVRIVEDKLDRKPKGFGYVEFGTQEGLKTALSLSGSSLAGRQVRVSVAEPREYLIDRTVRPRADMSQRRTARSLVTSATGRAKGPFQIFQVPSDASLSVVASATAMLTMCPMQAAIAAEDEATKPATAKSETSQTGRERAHFLPPRAQPCLCAMVVVNTARTVRVSAGTRRHGEKAGHRMAHGHRDVSMLRNLQSNGSQQHLRWIMSGEQE